MGRCRFYKKWDPSAQTMDEGGASVACPLLTNSSTAEARQKSEICYTVKRWVLTIVRRQQTTQAAQLARCLPLLSRSPQQERNVLTDWIRVILHKVEEQDPHEKGSSDFRYKTSVNAINMLTAISVT
jgi:hypothetical protein